MQLDRSAGMEQYVKGKDLVSVLNGLLGFTAIVLAHQGELMLAAGAMVGAALADALDGFVARRFSTPTEFGEAIDIADLISFGAAPGFFIIVWLPGSPLTYVTGTAIVVAALLRLARFQVREDKDGGWVGVPITVNGLLYPLLFILAPPYGALITVALVGAYLNVSALDVPKPG